MVAIFPKLCLRRRSLCSNLGGIGLEKLYRATLSLPGERKEELLELHTDDAIGYKFTVAHYQYSSG